jgi:rhamnulokinase
MSDPVYAAVDLGAESGRVITGRLADGRVALEQVHRFPNRAVETASGLHWDLPALFNEVLSGLGRAAADTQLAGVGVDTWGADYALLDGRGELLGTPFHYRDGRTDGMVARAHARVGRSELYAATGIQTMPINTIFQLLADGPALEGADRIALIPDLFNLWLTGELANEATVASTTGLLDARTGAWAREVVARLGLPAAPFAGEVTEPGVTLGPVRGEHATGVPVHIVAAHDTASAFAAAPLAGPTSAILSSGTWSLLGLELDRPVLSDEACAFNLSNERGIDGTTRLLANVMGLWLLQQCREYWQAAGARYEYDELHRLAAAATPDVPVLDPDDARYLAPGDMPARIAAACREGGQAPPATPGEFVRSVLVSLSCKYRLVLERLERAAGIDVDVVHVIGGGARNALLCQLTATMLGRPVHAGPVEAAALGNVLVQARARGELESLSDVRAVAAASADVSVFEPEPDRAHAEQLYGRFLDVCPDQPRDRIRTGGRA